MHDIRWIRENPEAFDRGLARRGLPGQAAALVALDDRRRQLVQSMQEAQTRRNAASKEIAAAMGAGDPVTRPSERRPGARRRRTS